MKERSSFLGSLITGLSNTVTSKKDALKNYGKKPVHPTAQFLHLKNLSALLSDLGVEKSLKAAVMEKAKNSTQPNDFTRSIKILSCLKKHGLRGYSASEFLKGAHFKIEDNGALYRDLAKIEGAETRFSSHFASTRIGKEMGISCGRILPEVLFLQSTQVKGPNFSHFQAEASPWRLDKSKPWALPNRETLQTSEHITDSAYYFISKKISLWLSRPVLNLGPYGWSIHDDANPITSCDYNGLGDDEDLGYFPDDLDELAEALTQPVGELGDKMEENDFEIDSNVREILRY